MPDIGYLHRGDEKIAENMTYTQFIPYTDRLDYLAPLANNVAYALAVEKLLGIDKQLPPRCQYIRVICCELARISSHLLGVGCFAMDVGAMTVFLHTFTEREKIYNLCESLTGARFTTSYTRIGGVVARPAAGLGASNAASSCNEVVRQHSTKRRSCSRATASSWIAPGTSASSRRRMAIDYGLTGPNLRGSGVDYDLRKAHPYLVYDQTAIRRAARLGRRLLRPLPRAHGGDAPERAHPPSVPRQTARRPDNRSKEPINVADGKIVLPPKDKVLTSMEELIHQFILVTQGMNAPPGEIYFGAENPKGELGFYINSKGGGTPHRLKIRAPSS